MIFKWKNCLYKEYYTQRMQSTNAKWDRCIICKALDHDGACQDGYDKSNIYDLIKGKWRKSREPRQYLERSKIDQDDAKKGEADEEEAIRISERQRKGKGRAKKGISKRKSVNLSWANI